MWLSVASLFLATDDSLKTFHVIRIPVCLVNPVVVGVHIVLLVPINPVVGIDVAQATHVAGVPVVTSLRISSIVVVPPTKVTSSIVVPRLLFLDVDIKVAYFASFSLLRDCWSIKYLTNFISYSISEYRN